MNLQLNPRLLIALAVVPMTAVAGGQQPAGQKPASDQPVATMHVQAREVLLPVVVRDKHGALVTTLQKTDFTLAEDGRPQVIKSFTQESNLPFQLGLLVDTSRSVSAAMEDERKAATKFVDQMLPDGKAGNDGAAKPAEGAPTRGDAAFLLHFDREVELLQDFSTSREKLDHEIEQMGSTGRAHDDAQGPETTGDDRERQRGNTRNGTQLYDAIFLAADELMKPKDGRKALVVFSDGLDRGSKETLNEALDAADHASVSIYTIYFKGEQERDNSGFPGQRRGGMGGGWPGGGGGYPGGGGGYPGGGRRGGEEKSQVDGKKIMEKIATQTGGRYFEAKKRENLQEIYGVIAEELRGQYLLSYTPDVVDNDGGYHKVALKANKDDLSVQTRAGYYAPGGDSSR
ncbi:MAG TPA: VWA domain-containing protein [Terracidiphilus sp.]|nr:VWA domain-containing protein [Terracidiphilus sp.]